MPNESDLEAVLGQRRDRQRDAVDGDRALLDAIAEHVGRRLDRDPAALALRLDRADLADAVNMALNVMATERVARSQRRLQIDLGSEGLGALQRLRHHVERERAVRALGNRQTDPVDGNGVSHGGVERALDHEPAAVERCDLRALANDAGEHGRKPTQWARVRRSANVAKSSRPRA